MAHKIYDNFFLSNEIEDQFDSHLNLLRFATIDNSLVGTAGMRRVINRYSATNSTQKLKMTEGNTKSIEVSYEPVEYVIELAQNHFDWYDEQQMIDPMVVPVGMRHMGTDMFNTVNADIYGQYFLKNKAGDAYLVNEVKTTAFGFDCFADAVATLNIGETVSGDGIFALICKDDVTAIRKALKDSLQYVEAYARQGYVGTVAGVSLYIKENATAGSIVVANKEAVTVFNKKGVEVEQERDANTRHNDVYSRKYYVAALTDATKACIITLQS